MSDILLAVVLIVVILAIAYYLVKKLAVLVINAVLGLIFLFVLNTLQVMQWVGQARPRVQPCNASHLRCGGLPGGARPCPAQHLRRPVCKRTRWYYFSGSLFEGFSAFFSLCPPDMHGLRRMHIPGKDRRRPEALKQE